jgi:hypothetical protein
MGSILPIRRGYSSRYALGFEVLPGEHPIIPVMIGDAVQAEVAA